MFARFARASTSLATVLTLMVLGSSGHAQQPTDADSRLEAFLDAHASRDPAVHERFLTESCAPSERAMDQRVATFGRIAELTGGLDLHRIESRESGRIVALAQQRRDQRWVRLELQLEAERPFRVTSFGLELTSPPLDALASEALDREGFLAELAALVGRRADDGSFSGAIRVARRGEVLFERAAGLADRRFGVANRVDTKFNLGSANKSFTAVAIAQLVESGRLGYEDRLVDLVPDLPRPERLEKITVAHLLSHRSGLGDYWEQLFASDFWNQRTHRQLTALAIEDDPAFEPGTGFRYSNLGYVLLGRILEEVSGQDYFDYVREHVLGPAGMEESDSWAIDDPVENLATGYTRQTGGDDHGEGPWRSNVFLHAAKGCAAGGGYSTVGDLHRFVDALWGDLLISPASRRRLHTPVDGIGEGRGYGFGFGIRGEGPLRSIGHNGGAPGISADYRHYPELGVTVAIGSNVDGGARELPGEIEVLLGRWSAGESESRPARAM